ncbi:MAG: hypothetical protein ACREFB_08570 [Stellaceae bacterium]
MSLSVGDELKAMIVALVTLSSSDSLRSGDPAAFRRWAEAVVWHNFPVQTSCCCGKTASL